MDLDTQNNDSAHASRFLYIFLLSLHDYDVKLPNFTFFRGREHKTIAFFKLLMTPTVPTCNKESLILRLLYLLVMIKRRAQTEECSVYSRIARIIQDNLSSTRQSVIQTVMILSQSAKKRGLNKSQCMDCPPGQKKKEAVVERWPLGEVQLYFLFSHYWLAILTLCMNFCLTGPSGKSITWL